jgi:CheY-like chemotaxis protein
VQYKKILIVDDSSTARMLIRNFLQIAGLDGADFYESEDGSGALSLIDEVQMDLVISDIIMPKLDGNVFIKKLRLKERYKKVPVIILTSLNEDSILPTVDKDPWSRILQKPVTPEKLAEVLGEMK